MQKTQCFQIALYGGSSKIESNNIVTAGIR